MAGRGPAPKDPAQRRRRNEPTRGEWVDLPALTEPVLPKLPTFYRNRAKFSQRMKSAWDAWRQDPATTQFGPAEIAAALELAYLMEAMIRGDEKAAEIRLRMDGLGLTAKGKRDLRWRVVSEATEAAKGPMAEVRELRAV